MLFRMIYFRPNLPSNWSNEKLKINRTQNNLVVLIILLAIQEKLKNSFGVSLQGKESQG
jgi:hypothetical protein